MYVPQNNQNSTSSLYISSTGHHHLSWNIIITFWLQCPQCFLWSSATRRILLKHKADNVHSPLRTFQGLSISPRVKATELPMVYQDSYHRDPNYFADCTPITLPFACSNVQGRLLPQGLSTYGNKSRLRPGHSLSYTEKALFINWMKIVDNSEMKEECKNVI